MFALHVIPPLSTAGAPARIYAEPTEGRGCKKGFERRNKCALPYMSKAHARHQSRNLPIQSAHQKCAAPAPALCYLFLLARSLSLTLSDVHAAN
jgi:hypothetical protein